MRPAPWISCELGWFVAEYGRQPWTIDGVLPTHLSGSTLGVGSLYGSLAGFVGFHTVLLGVEVYLMQRFTRQGPASLGTGRYEMEPPGSLALAIPRGGFGGGPAWPVPRLAWAKTHWTSTT